MADLAFFSAVGRSKGAIQSTAEAVALSKRTIALSNKSLEEYGQAIFLTREAILSSYDAMSRIDEAIEHSRIEKF